MNKQKFLSKHIKKYSLFYIIGIAALLAVDFIQLFIPQFLGEITGIFRKSLETGEPLDTQRVGIICLFTLLVAVGMMVGRIIWRLTIFNASHKIEEDIRHEMFVKAEQLPISYFHETKVGTIMSWFTNDIDVINEFIGWGTIMLIDAVFLSLMVIVKMFIFNWQFSLLALSFVILIVIWGAVVERKMSKKWNERQLAYDELYDYSQESFSGIRVIKAFVKEKQQHIAFAKVAKKNQQVNIEFVKIRVIFDVLLEVILGFIFAFILGLGGYFVYLTKTYGTVQLFLPFTMNVEDLVEFLGYFDTLIWPLIAMGQIVTMFSRFRVSVKRIKHYLFAPVDIKDNEDSILLNTTKGKIVFNNFSFTYPNENKKELENISCTIMPGEHIGIVGKIGSGKTTLVNSLLRLYNVDRNSILIDDNDIMDIKIQSLRDNIAYVPQDNFLFSDSISNNITFGDNNISLDKIKNATKLANVDSDIDGFVDKYGTIIGERGVTLSGGQKQRISIARALIKDSPILIMDDSVSSVDVKTEEQILQNLKENRKNKTTLIIASRISTVVSLDKIIVLNDGKIVGFDNHENLLKNCDLYQRIFNLQQIEKEVKK